MKVKEVKLPAVFPAKNQLVKVGEVGVCGGLCQRLVTIIKGKVMLSSFI